MQTHLLPHAATVLGALALALPCSAQENPKPARPAVKLKAVRAVRLMGAPATKPKSQAELKKLYEEKIAQEWVGKAAWTTDFDKARADAKAGGRQILAYFTRSYAP